MATVVPSGKPNIQVGVIENRLFAAVIQAQLNHNGCATFVVHATMVLGLDTSTKKDPKAQSQRH